MYGLKIQWKHDQRVNNRSTSFSLANRPKWTMPSKLTYPKMQDSRNQNVNYPVLIQHGKLEHHPYIVRSCSIFLLSSKLVDFPVFHVCLRCLSWISLTYTLGFQVAPRRAFEPCCRLASLSIQRRNSARQESRLLGWALPRRETCENQTPTPTICWSNNGTLLRYTCNM